jgi:hypothetical protein
MMSADMRVGFDATRPLGERFAEAVQALSGGEGTVGASGTTMTVSDQPVDQDVSPDVPD